MPKYIVFRTVGKLSEEEIEAAGLRSVEALDLMPEVRWIRSYYSAAEGKIYCEYEAPSAELIFEHARRAGIPIDQCRSGARAGTRDVPLTTPGVVGGVCVRASRCRPGPGYDSLR